VGDFGECRLPGGVFDYVHGPCYTIIGVEHQVSRQKAAFLPRGLCRHRPASIEPAGVGFGVKHLMGGGRRANYSAPPAGPGIRQPVPGRRKYAGHRAVGARAHGVVALSLAKARAVVASTMEFGRNEEQ
jgi:hypothetical protein